MRISFCGDKKAKIKHNTREFISANVDKNRIKDNIVIINQTVQEAYKHVFGEAQREYNSKQKRKDRKIDNYYTHLFGNVPESKQDEVQTNKNNQNSFWEDIVQIGDKDSAGILTNPKNAQIVTECLQEYAEGFQERNPYLYVFNAIIHLDEQTPHLHLDTIPFSDDYKKGMGRQLSIAKALEAMGYSKNCDEAIRDFTANERKIILGICERHGLEIEPESKSRGITFTPQQMRDGISEQYTELKEVEKNLQEKKSLLQEAEKSLQEKQSALSEVTAHVQTATTTVNALQEQEQELKEKVDEAIDLIRNFTPSPTKTVKFFGREKEVEKTDDELKTEKMILTAQELLAQREEILSEATREARLVVSSAETTAQEIISKAESSEIVLTAKAEAEQVLKEAKTTKEIADDYFKDRIALADEEAEERSRQLDEREAHINALAELSRPTSEYEESMQWLYGMSVRHKEEELAEEVEEEQEENLEFDEEEIEVPDYYYGL